MRKGSPKAVGRALPAGRDRDPQAWTAAAWWVSDGMRFHNHAPLCSQCPCSEHEMAEAPGPPVTCSRSPRRRGQAKALEPASPIGEMHEGAAREPTPA